MVTEIDCRKQTCPLPVVNTKKALEQSADSNLLVVVDNIVSRDNVRRFVQSQGHEVKIEDRGGNLYYMHITRNPGQAKSLRERRTFPQPEGWWCLSRRTSSVWATNGWVAYS